MIHYSGHPVVSGGLVAAGILPLAFNSQTLSTIYWALLLPPAAYHCYVFIHDTILPLFKRKP